MSPKQTPFSEIIQALADENRPFPAASLRRFSDLEPADLRSLLDEWPRIKTGRKRKLLADLWSLLEVDTVVSFDELARPLLKDPDAQVRALAIRLLGECEDHKLVPTYLDMLIRDESADVRAAAATVLGLFMDLGELEEIPAALYHKVEDALIAVVKGGDTVEIRQRALESLGYSSREEVAELIEQACARIDPVWVACALFAMGRSGLERWSDEVLTRLNDDHAIVRLAAIKAAGELDIKEARPLLLRMLEEGENDADVFEAVIWSLSQIGGEDVRIYLTELLDQAEDDELAALIEEALANLDFTEEMAQFDLLALDPDDEDDLKEI
jgi:HEAT repeat protein